MKFRMRPEQSHASRSFSRWLADGRSIGVRGSCRRHSLNRPGSGVEKMACSASTAGPLIVPHLVAVARFGKALMIPSLHPTVRALLFAWQPPAIPSKLRALAEESERQYHRVGQMEPCNHERLLEILRRLAADVFKTRVGAKAAPIPARKQRACSCNPSRTALLSATVRHPKANSTNAPPIAPLGAGPPRPVASSLGLGRKAVNSAAVACSRSDLIEAKSLTSNGSFFGWNFTRLGGQSRSLRIFSDSFT
jgi:hypothetical protein